MSEFQPRVNGFTSFVVPESWIERVVPQEPDDTLTVFLDVNYIHVKDPEQPVILRFSVDYHLEVYFFKIPKLQ